MAQVNFKFVSNTKGLQDGLKKSQKGLKNFEGATKKISSGIGKALGGLGVAFGASALISGLTNATKAAAEDLKQQRLLAGQLKRTTKASDAQVKGAERYIDVLSNQTGILDDDLRPALANAVRGTGSLQKGQKLLQVALDGSVASGKPLDTVLNALIKAHNGNTTSLYKLAPELRKTKGTIDDYAKSVKGAAEAGADPFARFNVAIENLNEQFGALLLPYVTQFVDFLTQKVIPAVSDFFDDVDNPNTDTGKVFKILQEAMVGKNGRGGIKASLDLLIETVGNLFATLSKDADPLDGFVKAIRVSAIAVDAMVYSLASFINAPITGFFDRIAKQGKAMRDIAAVLNEPSMFGNGIYDNVASGQVALSARIAENTTGARNYTININKANMTPQEIIAAIKQYERSGGKK